MDSNKHSSIDPVDLINEHYESVEMADEYRRNLLAATRGVVASRRKKPLVRWVVGLAGAVAVVVLIMLMLHQPQVRPTNHKAPALGRTAEAPKISAPFRGGVNAPVKVTEKKPPTTQPMVGMKHMTAAPSVSVPQGASGTHQPGSSRTATHKAPQGNAPEQQVSRELVVAVVRVQQPVLDGNGKTLDAGDRLPAGVAMRTGKGGRVTLVTAKGSELHLDSNSELEFTSGSTAAITRGRLYCANREKEIARIDTPAGQVKLLGTVVDTAVVGKDSVAVTVVEGKVQLSNKYGNALVDAGNRSVLSAFRPPQAGKAVNAYKETAWYQGRGEYQSDFGDIAYTVRRGDGLVTEVWTMNADGSGRHRVKSYVGGIYEAGQWLPGEQWLALQTHTLLWTTPDMEKRRAHTHAGHPITKTRTWLLNAVTGQHMLLQLPEGYDPLYMSYSPDADAVAFSGSYNPEPGTWATTEAGVWVYNVSTGAITKFYDGWIKTPVAWGPDNRRLAISSGVDYTNDHSLVLIDTQTGKVRDLEIPGAGAVFSPDGTKLAYCGDFKRGGGWFMGVPVSGSIFVLDLVSGGEPVRVSPAEDDALMPRWSPDGSRIVYVASNSRVCAVRADGMEQRELYRAQDDGVSKASWTPDGSAVFVSTRIQTLLVAADGSGVIKTLSQSDEDSRLSQEQQTQTDAAADAIREAVFLYAMGNIHLFEADLDARRRSLGTAADIFSELVWNYPLSGLSPDDVLNYADKAGWEAGRSDSDVLACSCEQRIGWLGGRIATAAANHKQFAHDLPTLMEWVSTMNWRTNWLSSSDQEHVKMLGLCPGTTEHAATPVIYMPPADGKEPEVGDVLLRCPLHPDNCFVWDESCDEKLNRRLMGDGKPGDHCELIDRWAPYRFENVGDGPLTVIYHSLSDTYEVLGKVRLLPTGIVYNDETVQFGALDEGSVARAIDAAGFVDWGTLSEEEIKRVGERLEFCRCVARHEAGLSVNDCELFKSSDMYEVIDGEPAMIMFRGPAGGSCGAIGTDLRFELIGPGDIKLYQLKPSGRFRVYGTVRVLQTKQTCANGWIDRNGNVTDTER